MLVNDQPVTLAAVRSLARRLVEMHGQNEHVSLFARDAQLGLLDQFAGVSAELETVRALHARRRELEQELEGLSHNEQERLRTLDLLGFQVRELEQAKLQPGEDAQLGGRAEDSLQPGKNPRRRHAAPSRSFTRMKARRFPAWPPPRGNSRSCAATTPPLPPEIEPLAAARATLEDIAAFLRDYVGKLEANPARLEEIEDRLALIDRLKRKYGSSVEAILAYAAETRQNLASLEHADERREAVRKDLAKAAAEYRKAAEALSEKRRDAARRLVKLVREELAQLGMEKTRMEVHFESAAGRPGRRDGN